MSEPREPLSRIVVAGAGQVGVLAAIALKRALPRCAVTVLGLPPDPAAFADHAATALPFTNRLHDRLGIDEARLVREGGASHRLVLRYAGWGGPGQSGTMAYGAELDPALRTAFARDWGGGPRNASAARSAGSLPEVLAEAGRFAVPPEGEPSPLAEIDYALRWNPPAYRQLLIGLAERLGIGHAQCDIAGIEPDEAGGIAAVSLAQAEPVAADLFVDCSGSGARLLSALPEYRTIDWTANLPLRRVLLGRPGAPVLALADRVDLLVEGWRSEVAGRDGVHPVLGLAPDVGEDAALRALGAEPIGAVPLSPGCAVEPWLGNVVALGDAAARFEPLGFLNLDLAHRQLDLLLEMLPGRRIEPLERAEFNRRAGLMADAARDTVAAHYAAPAARERFGALSLSEPLARALDQFARRGRLPFQEEAALHGAEFQALLAALGFAAGTSPQLRTISSDAEDTARRTFAARAQRALEFAPPYPEWMSAMLRSPAPRG